MGPHPPPSPVGEGTEVLRFPVNVPVIFFNSQLLSVIGY